MKRFGLTLLSAALACAVYGASPAEAKPKARSNASATHQSNEIQVAATVREYEGPSKINEDFDDSYEMEHLSGG